MARVIEGGLPMCPVAGEAETEALTWKWLKTSKKKAMNGMKKMKMVEQSTIRRDLTISFQKKNVEEMSKSYC